MDEEIISEKTKNKNIDSFFENITAPESQIVISKKPNTKYKNMNFLKVLTYGELILYIILNKIENK